MKFSLQFKTPNVIDQLAMNKDDLNKAKELVENFVKWDEYATLEFDTDTKTCVVLPASHN